MRFLAIDRLCRMAYHSIELCPEGMDMSARTHSGVYYRVYIFVFMI